MSPRESGSEMEYESDNRENEMEKEESVFRAIYSYISQEEGEVNFNEGDMVEVIQRSNNGWWLVRTTEGLGWGPSNYLQSVAS